jgi:hypothetical protein
VVASFASSQASPSVIRSFSADAWRESEKTKAGQVGIAASSPRKVVSSTCTPPSSRTTAISPFADAVADLLPAPGYTSTSLPVRASHWCSDPSFPLLTTVSVPGTSEAWLTTAP